MTIFYTYGIKIAIEKAGAKAPVYFL